MALINTPASLPAPMWAVVRHLAAVKKPVAVNTARSVLSPSSLHKDDKADPTFDNAVRTLTEYGAVAEANDRLALSDDWTDLTGGDPGEFADRMRHAIFAPERNDRLAETDGQEGPRDLTRALCWFLSLDPMAPPLSFEDVEQQQRGALPAKVGLPIRNDTRWGRFIYWGPVLGLAANSLFPGEGRSQRLAVDCTAAVRRIISGTWKPGQTIDAADAVAALRKALPVLPGGAYSIALGLPTSAESVGAALSYALLCGHDQGWIRLERKADAPRAVQVIDPGLTSGARRVTHVTVLGDPRG
ncbi:protein DpdG [Catenulispora pinisilvae]|uniref:protein DpdG n=1 Tax=Catenulispora pinisilvae TaxID=2705253 RepID=UPI001891BA4D|nr:protein DpdG [Catenulispora pinisilvae]